MPPSASSSKTVTALWLLLALAAVWTVLNDRARIRHIQRVTELPEWSVDAPKPDPASPTGYAGGWRRLILPEHNHRSFLWIAQTQQMLAEGRVRVRHIGFENAPLGRESNLPSPYAWWLAALASTDRLLTGEPAGRAVERAVLYADPLLQLLIVAGAAGLTLRWLGPVAAGVLVLGAAAWFPLAGNFLPGAPDSEGLLLGTNLLAGLALLAGLRAGTPAVADRRFVLAGAAGGFGLWLDAPVQMAVVAGLLAGGLGVRFLGKTGPWRTPVSAWRKWGLAGALVAAAGYLVEYAPGDMRLRLEANHPLYVLAWLGTGEFLAGLTAGVAAGWKERLARLLPLLAVAALPVGFLTGDSLLPWQLRPDPGRISVLHNLGAEHLFGWMARDGLSLPLVAALLPLPVAAVAAGLAWRRGERERVVFLGGPCLVLLGLAAWQPCWWSLLQTAVLVWLLAGVAGGPAGWWAAGLLAAIPGLAVLFQPRGEAAAARLTESELVGVIGRDLAHALSRQRADGRLLVLAPPELTTALHHYAGIRGLGTLAWENRAGLSAAVRIASATSPEEALHLVGQRGVTHLVMPSWDRFLEEYAGFGRSGRSGAAVAQNSFVAAIQRWEQPGWLWPRAYTIAPVAGFEGQRIEVFEVGDEQDAAGAMSRLAEYFVETGRLELAAAARRELKRYPAHPGALAAAAKVDAAHRDGAAFATTMAQLMPLIEAGGTRRGLPWDRRVSLAVVLATARKDAEAAEQLERCVRDANEERLRTLSPQALFQLLTLMKRSGLEFSDAALGDLARSLLPPEARGRL